MSVATTAPQFGRVRPLASLALALAFIFGHHQYFMQQGDIYPYLLILFFMVAGFAIGGIVYPPVFYALTKWGGHLPTRFKVMGALCGLAGGALGLYVLLTAY